MTVRLSVDLDGMTWGDLYNLVDAARAAGIPDDQRVSQVPHPADDASIVTLEVELPSLDGERSVTFDHTMRLRYADALGAVIMDDGDARGQITELQHLRDGLLGH